MAQTTLTERKAMSQIQLAAMIEQQASRLADIAHDIRNYAIVNDTLDPSPFLMTSLRLLLAFAEDNCEQASSIRTKISR